MTNSSLLKLEGLPA